MEDFISKAQGKGQLNSTLHKINENGYDEIMPTPRDSNISEFAGFAQNYYPKSAKKRATTHPADDSHKHSQLVQIPGEASDLVKEKWAQLGPLSLEAILANTKTPVDQNLPFGQSKYNKYIMGQIGKDGRVQGLGKEFNLIIYEGQFKNDVYHGFGRFIYSNGNYYIGNWENGKRSGRGKFVDASGKIYSGLWMNSKLVGK